MSDSMRDTGPVKHPLVVAFEVWRDASPKLFDGSADGRYLSSRLQEAFQHGWIACERTVKSALDGKA